MTTYDNAISYFLSSFIYGIESTKALIKTAASFSCSESYLENPFETDPGT